MEQPLIADAWSRFSALPNAKLERGTRYMWQRFASWLANNHPDIKTLAAIPESVMAEYARDLDANSISPRSQEAQLQAVRAVIDTLNSDVRTELIPPSVPRPARAAANGTANTDPTAILEQIRELLDNADSLSARERKILTLLG